MAETKTVRRILIIGIDEEVNNWFKESILRSGLKWKTKITDNLRFTAPENQISTQDIIIIIWEHSQPATIEAVLNRRETRMRTSEGVLTDLQMYYGENTFKRIAVLARELTREDTVLLAESGIKQIYTLPAKKSQWENEFSILKDKIAKSLNDLENDLQTPIETVVNRFTVLLASWSKIPDERKLAATEVLLRTLGDTARYSELMARKSLKEGDIVGAERWLQKAINQNPNYIQATNSIVSLYMKTKRFSDALQHLEKIKLSSPKNIIRLNQIGACYLAMEEYSKAEKVLSDAIGIDEYFSPARENLGKVKSMLGEYEAARSLLATTKNSHELAVFFNSVGIKMVENKEFWKAIEHYKKAQFVLPGNSESHILFFNISLAYLKWGKIKESLCFAKLALIKNPAYEKATQLVTLIENKKVA